MTRTCNILSNSGAAQNSAGGRNAANFNWNPMAGGPFKCLISRYKCALPLGTPDTTKNRVALV